MDAVNSLSKRPPRKHYFINKVYQGRFIAWLCGLAMMSSAIAGAVAYLGARNAVVDIMYRSHMPTRDIWQVIMPPLIKINVILAAVFFVLAALAVAVLMGKSKQALRRLETDIRNLIAPDPIRDRAAPTPFGLDVHALARESLCRRIKPLVEAADSLGLMAARGREALRQGNTPGALPAAPEIHQILDDLEKVCKQFQTKG